VRACVIFNPAAKGDKARQLRKQLDVIAAQCALKPTTAAGDARPLATAAIAEGFDHIIAAGGDGTLNEVLNGIADAPNGFERVCLGVLPLGTVNVFARELKIPLRLDAAWQCIQRGNEKRIDVAYADFTAQGRPARRYFVQLAGAGLDARAIELVSWSLKKRIGPLAYIVAGLQALMEPPPQLTAANGQRQERGELVLIGNGSLYGGNYEVLEGAHLCDGKLHVCVFPRIGWWILLRCGLPLLARGRLPEKLVRRFQATEFNLTSASPTGFELEGELVGQLPAKFAILPGALRVIAP
jgi:diacylglycerol kinase (ATP)